ncbi:hypothetical protein [Dapis sp. BLCC M229]|uniref:hypothetical protein n=1 Tax=Dapis sp. BLCC M229 TaxID=3400188 RepID=UPI003CF80993
MPINYMLIWVKRVSKQVFVGWVWSPNSLAFGFGDQTPTVFFSPMISYGYTNKLFDN